MKIKIAAISIAAALMAFLSTPSWAVFSSKKAQQIPASVTTGGIATSNFTLTVTNRGAPDGADQGAITWVSPDPSNATWKIASQLIRLDSNISDANGGIQIYTDNKNNPGTVASPNFVDPTPTITDNADSNPAGLVFADGVNTTSSLTLPLAWTIHANPVTVGTDLIAINPDARPSPPNPPASSPFQWLFMRDANTPTIDFDGSGPRLPVAGFTPGDTFQVVKSALGIHFGQNPADFGGDDNVSYIYLEADFSTAFAQANYITSTVTVEAFTD